MKPLDPRLIRHAAAGTAAVITLGATSTALTIAGAYVLADALARAYTSTLTRALILLTLITVARATVAALTETAAQRAATAAKSHLRTQLITHALRLGPHWLTTQRATELATLATRGVNALDDYFAKYLPQLLLAVITPIAILAVITPTDPIAGVTIAITLPLIPIFMALVGLATATATQRRWRALARLGHHFLDVVAGLPTLKIFGRAKAQAVHIRAITDSYRTATMRTLRLAFLSSLVLELLATLSVALVAVGIGLRLVNGELTLSTALLVLLLAPEAYLPLRAVGTHYHASADGLAAARKAFAILDTPTPAVGTRPVPADIHLRVDTLTVTHPDRPTPAPDKLTFTLAPGELLAITGPSGTGKTTLITVLLGFIPPDAGGAAVTVAGIPLTDLDSEAWRRRLAWVAQHPHLIPGTVADNLTAALTAAPESLTGGTSDHGTTGIPDRVNTPLGQDRIAAALRAAACDDISSDQAIGEGGTGLSAGQRRRLALACALLRQAPLLLLDEPTAGVDAHREAIIIDTLRRTAAAGTAILVATHRPAVIAAADHTITLGPRPPAPDTTRDTAQPRPQAANR